MAHLGFLYGKLGRPFEAEAIIIDMKAVPGDPVLDWDLAGGTSGWVTGRPHSTFWSARMNGACSICFG